MSGRPYARNPRAPYADPRDLEAILPHTFRLEAPVRLRDAKHEAIRSAIRRRCMQKNWRKMISIRHRRLTGEAAAELEAEEKKTRQEAKAAEEKEDAVASAKKQVEDLEHKLQELTDQKHAKFQLLKDILVEEAKSKMAATGSSAAPTVAKKRRVEFKDPDMTPSPAKMQSPTPPMKMTSASPVTTGSNPPGSHERA
ncbi:hypothetical protein DVH05_024493 [Phytophthora capsici]|nr:hypothetical protein DVH05_024493 [Phytophthora capsici]|eukprot:jgi/Phyca11/10645/fgenesh1_pm.PHYCAscaffold_52_\